MKKGYTLKAADKPVHAELARRFREGSLYAWSVHDHDAWYIYPDEAAWDNRMALDPVSFTEARAFAGLSTTTKRRSTAELVAMVERLAKVATDPALVAEAERLVAA